MLRAVLAPQNASDNGRVLDELLTSVAQYFPNRKGWCTRWQERWLSVAQAAVRLKVSPRRVRQLLAAGELAGENVGGRALLDAAQVESRAARHPSSGRPFSPALAWMVLAVLSDPASPEAAAADRSTRHRLRRLLAQMSDPKGPSVEDLESLLRRRARSHRFWIHPGLMAQVFADPRVSAGRARAAAAYGLDVSPGDDALGYIAESDLADRASPVRP